MDFLASINLKIRILFSGIKGEEKGGGGRARDGKAVAKLWLLKEVREKREQQELSCSENPINVLIVLSGLCDCTARLGYCLA